MVVVTEQGVADLRGLSPRERAESIIKNCAHPDYREALYEYVNESCEGKHKHTPHMLDKAFDMHNKFIKFKSMKAEEVLI